VSRQARKTLKVLEIGRDCIERDFISSRTKEALAKRKAEGMKLGRPVAASRIGDFSRLYTSKVARMKSLLRNVCIERHGVVLCCVA